MPRGVVFRHAEADRLEAVLAGTVQQPAEKLMAVTPAAAARDDRNRELWRLLVDEPETGVILREQAVPRPAGAANLGEKERRPAAGAPPAVDVPGQGRLLVAHR